GLRVCGADDRRVPAVPARPRRCRDGSPAGDRGGGFLTMLLSVSAYDAIILDLDGVVTDTAALHEAAWRKLFNNFLGRRPPRKGENHRPFTHEDYLTYVDGKARYDGARDLLVSRGIALPWGTAGDPPHRETICGLANRKDGYFIALLAAQ